VEGGPFRSESVEEVGEQVVVVVRQRTRLELACPMGLHERSWRESAWEARAGWFGRRKRLEE